MLDRNYILEIINEIWNGSNQGKGATGTLKNKYPDVFHYLETLYPTISNVGTRAWMFFNNVADIPKCMCGTPNTWKSFSRGFTLYCSVKCMSSAQSVINKRSSTVLERYGETHFSKTPEYKQKFKDTCNNRYGVDNPGQIPELKITRSKNKSQTYINNLIYDMREKYIPLFDICNFTGVHEPSVWKCLNCDEEFVQPCLSWQELNCDNCYPRKISGVSKLEKDIFDIVSSLDPSAVANDRSVLNGKELDILIESKNLAIEICGAYWHSDKFVDKNYHQEKFINCEKLGINLITLFDFDCDKREIIEMMLRNYLFANSSKRIYARNGNIIPVTGNVAKKFNETYHLRGHAAAKYHFGFVYNNEIVAVSSWTPNRFKNSGIELVRLCSKYPITGLLGKMTSHASIALNQRLLYSYVDLRYGNGRSYIAAGYTCEKITSPGYWYVDSYGNVNHRSSFSKSKLMSLKSYSIDKTEFQIMDDEGYHRIWDCGNKLFKWEAK